MEARRLLLMAQAVLGGSFQGDYAEAMRRLGANRDRAKARLGGMHAKDSKLQEKMDKLKALEKGAQSFYSSVRSERNGAKFHFDEIRNLGKELKPLIELEALIATMETAIKRSGGWSASSMGLEQGESVGNGLARLRKDASQLENLISSLPERKRKLSELIKSEENRWGLPWTNREAALNALRTEQDGIVNRIVQTENNLKKVSAQVLEIEHYLHVLELIECDVTSDARVEAVNHPREG